MCLRLCLRVAKIRTFAPLLVPLRCAGTIALLSDFCSAGWAAPAACSFLRTSGCAIRICFGYDDADELPAARKENIHVRAAFAFT